MNEFITKKLGELIALNRIGEDTLTKARDVLLAALGEEPYTDVAEKFRMHGEGVLRIATDAAVVDAALAQAHIDEDKLTAMRKDYMGDQYTDECEVFEWLGFFHGALIAHWALLRGIGEQLNHEDLLTLAEEGVTWNYEMLESAESELESRGQDKATA